MKLGELLKDKIDLLYALPLLYVFSVIFNVDRGLILARTNQIFLALIVMTSVIFASVYLLKKGWKDKHVLLAFMFFHLLIGFSFLSALGIDDNDRHFENSQMVAEEGMQEYFTTYLDVDETYGNPEYTQKRNGPFWALLLYTLQIPIGFSLFNAVLLTVLIHTATMIPL